jgi:hypothetical protein
MTFPLIYVASDLMANVAVHSIAYLAAIQMNVFDQDQTS